MIIGLDVGGTHTDAVLIGPKGLIRSVKVPTDAANLFQTVLDVLEQVTTGVDRHAIRRAVLSTTLATNLVVQGALPPVGMVVACGPGIDPENYRTNTHYHVIPGALDHRGVEITPLDEDQLESIGRDFQRQGIRCAGVVSKFSVRNPAHEKAMAASLAPHVGQVFMGHQVSGVLNFPRRIATTYLNAAVHPVHKDFFAAVQKSLAQQGLSAPIRILKPDGGNMNFDSSLDHPAQTILSGPSASVMGALPFAPRDGACLVLDIGGTTTDMAVLIDGVPLMAPLGIEIGPHKTLIRALLTHSIGIGGDSVVRLQNQGFTVGPDRIGRAMAYGGPLPTPTDAFFILGMTDQGDVKRAREGIVPLAEALGITPEAAADRIFTEACRQILTNAQAMVERINSKPVYTVHELWEGSQIRLRHILILGGPAPHFAQKLKTMFDGSVTVVPHWQVANAVGCALARTTSEIILYVDTARQMATAPGEMINRSISPGFDMEDARDLTLQLLREKALRRGANPGNLQMEIVEASQFNMIRGFRTVGRDIRVRAQVKPGLISGYDPASEQFAQEAL